MFGLSLVQVTDLCTMFLRRILLLVFLGAAAMALAQPADTVGVRSDTTLIRTPRPFMVDTLPSDTAVHSPAIPTLPPIDAEAAEVRRRDTLNWRQRHSPKRATLLSAVMPGAGQIYNRKYWKAPIVWAGLGISYTFIRDNSREYHRYRTAYLALVDGDPGTVDEFGGQYSPDQVRQVMETYQRWRDISYIATAGVYILNIVDASVDAHFVRFDVSPDLSLKLGPSLPVASMGGMGLSLQLAVK
jgi:hypothetical protein